jgi:16S rRNA (adenine1518-N6/adenine1519-N6)-dimethyltransferase
MPSHRPPRSASNHPPAQATRNPLLEEARHLRLKKRFSQHFLVNAGVLDRIAGLMDLKPEDTVVEIGPGSGFLTERLLERAGMVIAVELDRKMCEYLRKKFAHRPNFQLIEQDILRFDFETIETPRFKVVGNLPYAITSKIMFRLAGELDMVNYPLRQRIEQLTVMVQKEVGERITAKPGQKAYNPLSIALQFWFDPRFDFGVPARDFYPPPKVESAVVSLFPRTEPRTKVRDMAIFGRLVRTAFAQKRKTVRNALLNGAFANADILDKIFGATGIDSSLRAEALPVEAFGDLANALCPDPGQD